MINKYRVFLDRYTIYISSISGTIAVISIILQYFKNHLLIIQSNSYLFKLVLIISTIIVISILLIKLYFYLYPGVDIDRIGTKCTIKLLDEDGVQAEYFSEKIIKVLTKYRNSIPIRGLSGDGNTLLKEVKVYKAEIKGKEFIKKDFIQSNIHEISEKSFDLQFDHNLEKGKYYIVYALYNMKDSWKNNREYFRLKLNRHKHKKAELTILAHENRPFKTDSVSIERIENRFIDNEFSRALPTDKYLTRTQDKLYWVIKKPLHSNTYIIRWSWIKI